MKWLVDASLAAAPLILAVAALRALLLHRLPKKAFLALWAVAVFRLLMPISIPSPVSIHSLAAHLPKLRAETPQAPIVHDLPAILLETMPDNRMPVSDTLAPVNYTALLWGLGAATCMAAFIGNHTRRMREYRASLPVTDGPAADWLAMQRFRRRVRLCQSDHIAAPLTYGLLRPVILIPKGMEALSTDAARMALLHEAAHIRRLDILWKWLLAVTVSLHWFNPLCWALFFLAGRDMEMACDEAVVRSLGETAKSAYAMALLDMADRGRPFAAMDAAFSRNATEERILAIMKIRKKTVLAGLVAAMLVLGTATVFATSAPAAGQLDAANDAASAKTEVLDWFQDDVGAIIPAGAVFTIKDVKTGSTFQVKHLFGANHMDAEPLTQDDTARMKAVYGGDWSWERRAILILYDGRVFAASMNGMPHGQQSIYDNDFDGQFCIHFVNSKTHGTSSVDVDHQLCITAAGKATW